MSQVHVRAAQNHMATTFHFVVSCEQSDSARADRLLTDAHALVTRLENELSEFLTQSPIYVLNHAPPGLSIRMPRSAIQLFERSQKIKTQTSGAFDFLAKSEKGSKGITWCGETSYAHREDDGAHVGFGAIGKGYALDEVRTLLEQHGFTNYVLNAGGSSIICSGYSAPGEPWQWAWSWQTDADGNAEGLEFSHASGEPIAIGISGTHEKGQHIVGAKEAQQLRSALVAHSSATEADALSTALFVSGWKGQPALESAAAQPATAVIDHQGVPRWNGVFQNFWGAPKVAGFLIGMVSCLLGHAQEGEEVVLDLSEMGGALESFTPYLYERNEWWVVLPVLILLMTLLHLKRTRPVRPPAELRRFILPTPRSTKE